MLLLVCVCREAAAPYGFAPVSGYDHTVGVSGLLMGGGHGALSRQYGLAADQVMQCNAT